MDLFYIGQIFCRAAGVFQCPVVIPVKYDADICFIYRTQCRSAQTFQFFAQLFHFSEYSGIICTHMADHCAVEFFTATNAASQLEELNGICTVSNGLQTLCAHLAGFFQGVVRLPVLLAGCLFHQHKRCILQTAHQIMCHGSQAPGCVVGRIVIPGNDIHFLCPFEVIQQFISTHQICCNGSFFIILTDNISFHFIVIQHAFRHESAVIHGKTCKSSILTIFHTIAQSVGQNNFVPFINSMAPEFQIPSLVQCFDCFVFILQPYTECFFTVFAVAFAAIFVADVPACYMLIIAVAFCQLFCQCFGIFLENRRIGACVMTLTKFMMTTFIVCSCYFRIFLIKPSRHSTCGSCQNDIIIFFAQHFHDFIQFIEIIFFFGRLDLRPGENIDGCTVDTRIFEIFHIFFPDFFGPLIRVIIPTVQNATKCAFHNLSPHISFVIAEFLCCSDYTPYRQKEVSHVRLNNIIF